MLLFRAWSCIHYHPLCKLPWHCIGHQWVVYQVQSRQGYGLSHLHQRLRHTFPPRTSLAQVSLFLLHPYQTQGISFLRSLRMSQSRSIYAFSITPAASGRLPQSYLCFSHTLLRQPFASPISSACWQTTPWSRSYHLSILHIQTETIIKVA